MKVERMQLLQHELQGPDDILRPWRMIVVSLLLKQTRGSVARRVATAVLERWPTPSILGMAPCPELEEVLAAAGMQNRRGKELREVSRKYAFWMADRAEGDPKAPPADLVRTWHGCGPYIADAVRVLVHGEIDGPVPEDKDLRWWVESQTSKLSASAAS